MKTDSAPATEKAGACGAAGGPGWLPNRVYPVWAVIARRAAGSPGSTEVEAVEVHNLDPHSHEILHELRLRVR